MYKYAFELCEPLLAFLQNENPEAATYKEEHRHH